MLLVTAAAACWAISLKNKKRATKSRAAANHGMMRKHPHTERLRTPPTFGFTPGYLIHEPRLSS